MLPGCQRIINAGKSSSDATCTAIPQPETAGHYPVQSGFNSPHVSWWDRARAPLRPKARGRPPQIIAFLFSKGAKPPCNYGAGVGFPLIRLQLAARLCGQQAPRDDDLQLYTGAHTGLTVNMERHLLSAQKLQSCLNINCVECSKALFGSLVEAG